MTNLATTKTASQLRMAVAACQLAPHLYYAETAFLGTESNGWDELSPAQQRVFLERAEYAVLDNIGWLSGKAKERAHGYALLEHQIDGEFNAEARTLIDETISTAVKEYPNQLKAVWRESSR